MLIDIFIKCGSFVEFNSCGTTVMNIVTAYVNKDADKMRKRTLTPNYRDITR
jgi:hypothetical protein